MISLLKAKVVAYFRVSNNRVGPNNRDFWYFCAVAISCNSRKTVSNKSVYGGKIDQGTCAVYARFLYTP